MAGVPFREPVDTVCYDPWVEAHPGDHEPVVDGKWSWWPPGITCVHASGEAYIEPSPADAVAVGLTGLAVLIFGVAPTLLVTGLVWRRAQPSHAA